MRIIIEGPNGAGKSTLVKKLSDKYNLKIVKMTAESDNTLEGHMSLLNEDNIIIDRFYIGELVYGPLLRGSSKISDHDCLELETKLIELNAVIIQLNASVDVLKKRIEVRGKDIGINNEELSNICSKYLQIGDRLEKKSDSLNYTFFDNSTLSDKATLKLVDRFICSFLKKGYNTTDLAPDVAMDRHIFHRDQFAHYLRWSTVLKIAKIGDDVLDFGCGNGNLFEVFYRNKFKPKSYVGVDIREKTIEKANEKFKNQSSFCKFVAADLCAEDFNLNKKFNKIISFEVMEHIGKNNADAYLQNIKKHCNEETKIYISTPVYDPQVGAAGNHIINGKVGEFGFEELKSTFERNGFKIVDVRGTFISKKDYYKKLSPEMKEMHDTLSSVYDSNVISVIFAPLFAEESRNCFWTLEIV